MKIRQHTLTYPIAANSASCSRTLFRIFDSAKGRVVLATDLPTRENPGPTVEQVLPDAITACVKAGIEAPFEFWTHFNSRSFAEEGAQEILCRPTFSRVHFSIEDAVIVTKREPVLFDDAAKRLGLAYDEVAAL